jgi:hypothetical protein
MFFVSCPLCPSLSLFEIYFIFTYLNFILPHIVILTLYVAFYKFFPPEHLFKKLQYLSQFKCSHEGYFGLKDKMFITL